MFYATMKTVHVLSVLLWVGGMAFAHFFLRPAVAAWEPMARVRLMHAVLQRFFAAVVVLSLATLFTGIGMVVHTVRAVAASGGVFTQPLDWSVMSMAGTLMVLVFAYIRWYWFRRLARAVQVSDWAAGGAALQGIRRWVGVNLALGLGIVALTLLY